MNKHPSEAQHGLILFAHGSRDPQWAQPFEAMLARVRAADPTLPCALAYLELMPPDFATVVEQLWAKGVRQVRVLPVFLASGKHLRVDLPQLIQDAQSKHLGLNVQVLPAVGLTAEVQNAVVNLALAS